MTARVTGKPSSGAFPAELDDLHREIEQLRAALITRDAIGQAKGVIRAVFQCSEDAAFSALAALSQDSNRKVSEVALMIMDVMTSKRALTKKSMESLQRGIDTYRRSRA